jgi:hypothetical protein
MNMRNFFLQKVHSWLSILMVAAVGLLATQTIVTTLQAADAGTLNAWTVTASSAAEI